MSCAAGDYNVQFPLHAAVWENDYKQLENKLPQHNIEEVDPRGRTPLHLAVSLGHLESARVLLRHNAEVTKENAKGWTVLQEAVSTGDPQMVQLVLQKRDYLKASTALQGVPELLAKIRESSDFYMEMKWEFTSWIPLVSRMCPSDVCRIWKSGANLRVDATLLGFENMTWIRGRRSYIFRGEGNFAVLMEINHDEEVVDIERFDISREMEEVTLDSMQPAEQEVAKRLTSPSINTYLDTRHIAFERNKSGIWGWRSDKTEVINGFEAKVFTVNNVNVVIRTRTEHLTEEEKTRYRDERNILESLLGTVEQYCGAQGDHTLEFASTNNPTAITPEEYFNPDFDLHDRDIGRPIELTIRTQKFKATLWMSEEHPLSLVEQVTPIINLMARTSAHFARLRDFVTLKFPPGFPVKIEIPLFHVLNARITFGNVNLCSTEDVVDLTSNKTPSQDEEDNTASSESPFIVCSSVFDVPTRYIRRGGGRAMPATNHDEELLQFAIQQSLLESKCTNEITSWDGINGVFPEAMFESQYSRAAQESLLMNMPISTCREDSPDSDLTLAMELSARIQEEEERKRKEEQEELERILQLSLIDK
ncbi:ankyrin repeat domain-containing protein 13A isoform X1 [Polypterus senegalus]|uniref:ankyrin repeat domain-containing protein 13A isoform X1 n=2 Tax=Polypterus senegalus TaxID=55291 RepID=UPI001963A551|nr:ankyrin repeat domain-containing protein 13A isoform X1 [Polypterus senegalus]